MKKVAPVAQSLLKEISAVPPFLDSHFPYRQLGGSEKDVELGAVRICLICGWAQEGDLPEVCSISGPPIAAKCLSCH